MKGTTMMCLLATLAASSVQARAQTSKPTPACAGSEFRQFDFWLGDWDTYDMTDTSKAVAGTRVTRILGGCVLREVLEQATAWSARATACGTPRAAGGTRVGSPTAARCSCWTAT